MSGRSVQCSSLVLRLFVTCDNGNIKELRSLLAKETVNINQHNDNGECALYRATHHGHTDIVEELLQRGANANEKNGSKNWSALMLIASQSEYSPIAQLLLDHGAFVDMQDINECSALIIACQHNCSRMIKLLLERRASVDVQNKQGWSALMKASKNGHTEIIMLLLTHGADVQLRNKTGRSAFMIACQYGHSEIAKILL